MASQRDGITRVESPVTGKISWQARWTYLTPAGERKYASKTFPTKTKAREHLIAQKAKIQEGQYVGPSRLTLNEYSEIYFTRMRSRWVMSTTYHRESQWRRIIQPRLGGMRLSAITRAMCQEIIDDLHNQGRKPETLKNVNGLLCAMLNAAVIDGHLVRNPAQRLTLPPVRRDEAQVWDEHQTRTFLEQTRDHPWHAIYYVMLTTGVRVGEMQALRWENVDLQQGWIRIAETMRRQRSGMRRPEAGTKGGSVRTIELTAGCLASLRAYKETQDRQRAIVPDWDPAGYVLANDQGRFIDYVFFKKELGRVIARTGLPHLTPHGLRHTAATLMLRAGVQELVIQEMLGHHGQQLLKLYAHVINTTRRAATDRLASILDEASTTTSGTATTDFRTDVQK